MRFLINGFTTGFEGSRLRAADLTALRQGTNECSKRQEKSLELLEKQKNESAILENRHKNDY